MSSVEPAGWDQFVRDETGSKDGEEHHHVHENQQPAVLQHWNISTILRNEKINVLWVMETHSGIFRIYEVIKDFVLIKCFCYLILFKIWTQARNAHRCSSYIYRWVRQDSRIWNTFSYTVSRTAYVEWATWHCFYETQWKRSIENRSQSPKNGGFIKNLHEVGLGIIYL